MLVRYGRYFREQPNEGDSETAQDLGTEPDEHSSEDYLKAEKHLVIEEDTDGEHESEIEHDSDANSFQQYSPDEGSDAAHGICQIHSVPQL